MIKILTIVGTRPELIKMSCVIRQFDKFTNHILVHTGQNHDYELNEIFFKDLKIRKPDYFLNSARETAAKTIAAIIEKADEVFDQVKPDALLIYGDTNSSLCAIAAKRRKIPIFHMEAGNRCFDQRVPEEINRKIIDHISDINIVLTEHARRNLLDEGLKSETIFKSGSHMKEVLDSVKPRIKNSDILKKMNLRPGKYIIASFHREENVDDKVTLNLFIETLYSIHAKFKFPIVISTHPRTNLRLKSLKAIKKSKNIIFSKPFGFIDYINLQINAFCVLSDSGTISEEASLLNFPAVNLRRSHERPEGVDAGIFTLSGIQRESILNAIQIETELNNNRTIDAEVVEDYEVMAASAKILKIVIGYIDYVNKQVWVK